MPPKRRATAVAAETANATEPPAAVPDIDAERRERMARNAAALAAIGVAGAAKDLREAAAAGRAQSRPAGIAVTHPGAEADGGVRKLRVRVAPPVLRRSRRIAGGTAPPLVELDDDGKPVRRAAGNDGDGDGDDGEEVEAGGLLDLMACDAVPADKGEAAGEQHRVALEAQRCTAKSRGVYDKNLGISCHFCRQKTLCCEPNCRRCGARDASAACVGKTACGGCQSATGIFCRACLRVRYGQDLDEVRRDPSWRCPHCYERERGDWRAHGWFCNSSICMRAHGRMPTGIAIHSALEKGFRSVAHMLQAAVLTMSEKAGAAAGGGGDLAAAAAAAGPTRTRPAAVKKAAVAAAGTRAGKEEGDGGSEVQEEEEAGAPIAVAAAAGAVELGKPSLGARRRE